MTDSNALTALLREIESFRSSLSDRPVAPHASPEALRAHLSDRFDFSQSRSLETVIGDVAAMMRSWSLHTTHPRYFGLFNPNVTEASIAADALASLYNPQLATWSHAPAANEIERHVLNFFLRLYSFDPELSAAHFSSGGAEANHTAVVTALTYHYPSYGNDGIRSLSAQPVFYVSEQAHHSFHKAAHSTGLGRNAVRIVPVNRRLQLDCEALERQIISDKENGFSPFMAVGTVGSTPAGTIDPLEAMAELCSRHGLWFHADGAWGGAAVISESARRHLCGIERADSITCDAHKWLSVSMSAGMFFCRHKHAVGDAFRITASYMPEQVRNTMDNYSTSMQWSRRFIGLKAFMTLAERGQAGLAGMVDREIALGCLLRDELERTGWSLINSTPLPVVCFTHEKIRSGALTVETIVREFEENGSAWISSVAVPHFGGVLRACIINYMTTETDVAALVAELNRMVRK